jgi:hypothetical protein
MIRLLSQKMQASILLALVASFGCFQWSKMMRSPQRMLENRLTQKGSARVFLHDDDDDDDWKVPPAESMLWRHNPQAEERDLSCRRAVPDTLVMTMTSWGQWAATQSFFAKRGNPFEGAPNTNGGHHMVAETKGAPSFCKVGSFKRIVDNQEWTLDQFEFLSDQLPDFSDLRSYSYVLIKPLEEKDSDSVWVFTNSTERTHVDESTMTKQGQHFIQAYKLSYVMDMGNDFCDGMSMTMAMGGFQWSLMSKKKGDCLTYFAGPWKLNDRGKFHGAMVFSFLLALMTEGITAFQGWIKKFLSGKLRKVVMTSLYGVQQLLGYSTMLITMMYSLELFGCVILGLVVGRTLFQSSGRGGMAASRVDRNVPRTATESGASGASERGDVSVPQDSPFWGLRRRRS